MSEPLDLFAPLSRAERQAENARKATKAADVFRTALTLAGYDGRTMGECREAFVRHGVATGGEEGRQLSFLGRVPTLAHAVKRGDFRWYNGNRQPVWVMPQFARPSHWEAA